LINNEIITYLKGYRKEHKKNSPDKSEELWGYSGYDIAKLIPILSFRQKRLDVAPCPY